MTAEQDATTEELEAAEALARLLETGRSGGGPFAATLAQLDAYARETDVDVARVRGRVLRRARRKPMRLILPGAIALAAAAAIVLGTSRPRPAPVRSPEPDIALLEAQVRAATERGLRTDLDVEAWRYRRRLFAAIEGRYDR